MDSSFIILGLASLAVLIVALAVIFYMVWMHRPNEDFMALVMRSRAAWSEEQRNITKALSEKQKEHQSRGEKPEWKFKKSN